MSRQKITAHGETQSVSIRLSGQEMDALARYAEACKMGRSAAARQLMRTGPALRAEVHAEIMRKITPALTAFSDISADLMLLWCRHGVELIPIIGADTYSQFRDRIADAIGEMTTVIMAEETKNGDDFK